MVENPDPVSLLVIVSAEIPVATLCSNAGRVTNMLPLYVLPIGLGVRPLRRDIPSACYKGFHVTKHA